MLRGCIALLGYPLLWGLGRAFLEGCIAVFCSQYGAGKTLTWFFGGVGIMSALYFLFHRRLVVTYVFAHEMTHLLVGLCFLARPYRIEVSSTGGCVELSKTNLPITLSPYCVPFYLLLTLGVQALITAFWPSAVAPLVWVAIYGFWAGYHVLFTIETLLSIGQPDVRAYGRLFSYWLIVLVNLLLASVALCALGDLNCTFGQQFQRISVATVEAYSWVWTTLRSLIETYVMR